MKNFEERFTQYVDDRLDPAARAEFEQELAQHPDTAAEVKAARGLGHFLRSHAAPPLLTNVDFFDLQIMQRIAAEQPRERREEARGGWFASRARLAWVGAFCLLLAVLLFQMIAHVPPVAPQPNTAPYFAQVVEAWPSDPTISANTIYDPEENLTVLWLDGLDYIPASHELR